MIKRISIIVSIIAFGVISINCNAYSQLIPKTDYVILSFERLAEDLEDEYYYWIIPIDSIDGNLNFTLFPLYINSSSQYTTDRCIRGDSISFFKNFEGVSKEYENETNKLLEIIKSKKRKIQNVIIQWGKEGKKLKRKEEKIFIYATPITGVFCNCMERHEKFGSGLVEFRGLVYLPISNFSFNHLFWETENGKVIQYADYSLFDFAKFTPSMYHDKNRVRALINE